MASCLEKGSYGTLQFATALRATLNLKLLSLLDTMNMPLEDQRKISDRLMAFPPLDLLSLIELLLPRQDAFTHLVVASGWNPALKPHMENHMKETGNIAKKWAEERGIANLDDILVLFELFHFKEITKFEGAPTMAMGILNFIREKCAPGLLKRTDEAVKTAIEPTLMDSSSGTGTQ
jgi:hypothetical protein